MSCLHLSIVYIGPWPSIYTPSRLHERALSLRTLVLILSLSKTNKDSKRVFVMQHVLTLVSNDVSKCGSVVWNVDLGALNHMTSHGK